MAFGRDELAQCLQGTLGPVLLSAHRGQNNASSRRGHTPHLESYFTNLHKCHCDHNDNGLGKEINTENSQET